MSMVTKTLTITEEAYNLLARQKKNGESFSEVIKKELSNKTRIRDLYGILSDITKAEHERMMEAIEKSRKISIKLEKEELKKHETT